MRAGREKGTKLDLEPWDRQIDMDEVDEVDEESQVHPVIDSVMSRKGRKENREIGSVFMVT